MEVVLKNATSANKRLTNSGENDIKDPNLNVHGVRSSSKSGIIFKGFENPKVSVCEELATAERQVSFVNNRLSNGTNSYVNDPRKILCGGGVGKSMINGLSSKTIVIHATGVKKDSSLSSGGNYESSLDIQKVKEVNRHSVDQSLEAMRKKIALYISYSGSEESSSSDSEMLDFNDQKKDGCQMNRIIRNRGGEMSPKCVQSSKCLQGIENAVADRNSEVEKESAFSGDVRKFSMKWNITAKKVDSVNSLSPARKIWDDALIISHTERRSLNECELRHSLKLDSYSPKGMKTSEGNCENDDDKRDFFHGQNEKKTFSNNDAANRCISDKRMTSEHDSSWNDGNYSEKAQENTKLHDECSRGDYEQKSEDSREISFHDLKEKNENCVGSQEKPINDEEKRRSDSPRQTISPTTNKRIKNTNGNNNLRLISSFSEKSSKKQKSRYNTYKSSSSGYGIFEDPGSCTSTDANASPVRRSPEHKQLVLLAEERKSEELNSVTKSSSSDKVTTNLIARKKGSTESELKTLDESMTNTNKKEKVYNDTTSKQTTLGRRKPFKINNDKETRNDDEKLSISNRRRSRQTISLEKECRQRKFRESTSLERESKYGKQSCYDNEGDDERKSSSQRRYSRRSVSPKKELWQRQSREGSTSMDRDSKYAKPSHVDDESDDERTNSYSRSRYSGRSVSPEKERWGRKSRERSSMDRESKYAKPLHVDDDDDDEERKGSYSRSRRNSRPRSLSPEKECWQRQSRESTSMDRDSKYAKPSHVDNDSDDDARNNSYSRSRYSGRSVSAEKDRWRRKSRERTSMDRESKYAKPTHVEKDDDDDSKGSYYRSHNSRRSVSPENERWRRNSRESTSREGESEHAVRESRFRSPVPRISRMRRDLSSIRKQIAEAPVSSWIHNIVVKIADPPRAPIRKRRNRNDRRFIQRNRVEERSSNATDEERRLPEPSYTREDKYENDAAPMNKKKRWTYNDYAKQSDGSLKRKREFSDDEEDHFAWKRYDDERTMPYQGYADSQVQSLLKQLCGDYVTQLYSRESNIGEKPSSQNALGSQQDLKDHRSWFMTSSEWISYGEEVYRPNDQTKQPVTTKDLSTKVAVSVLWHTVPLLTNTKKENERGGKTTTEEANKRENQAKTGKRLSFDQERQTEQASLQEGSSTLNEKVTSQASLIVNADDILNNRSNNTRQHHQMAHSNMTEGTGISSSTLISDKRCVGSSDNFTSGSLRLGGLWNTSSCNDPLVTGQMTRNDLLVMVTPSSYWYEKQLLRKQKEEKPSKAKNTTGHHQSLYIPTSCCSSRQTDVSSFSVCFHCDTSRFDFSPQMLDSSEVDDGNDKARNDSVLEHTATPQTGKKFMESECNIHTSAKRQLNFGSITEMHLSRDSKTDDIHGKKDLIETIKDDQETGTRTDDQLGSISTSEKEISSPVINSNPDNLPMSERSSSSGTNSNATGLQMLDESIANKSAHLENINIKKENRETKVKGSHQEKTGDHQLVEVEKVDVHSETSENQSLGTHFPQRKIEKKNQLGEEEKVDVHSETSENQSLGTYFPQRKIEKKNQLGEEEKADVHSETSENQSLGTYFPQRKIEKKNQLGEEEKVDVHSETSENQSLGTHFPQRKIEKKNQLGEEEKVDVHSETKEIQSPGIYLPQEKIEKKNGHQLGEDENADVLNSETNENHSSETNLPQEKIEKTNDHPLGDEEKADFHSETGENRSSRTNLPQKKIEREDGNSSSMLKCLVEEVEEVGEEMWELALKTTSNETSGDGDNAISIGSALITKVHPKSGDLDVAVVKPSPRQKHRSALNESLETFAYQDKNNVNMVNPAITTRNKTQQEIYDTTKTPVQNEQKIQLVSQIKVAKKLEHSKKPPNFTRCFPSSTSVVLSSTPHMKDPLKNIQKRHKEAKLNPLDGTTEVLAVGRVIENFPQEKSVINLPLACSANSQQHEPPMRLFQAPLQSYEQDDFGYTFRTPNLQQNQQPQQQGNEFQIIHPPFSINNSIHMINNKHLSINTSSNAKVMPTLSNRQEILLEQLQGGDLSKSLRKQTVFIRDSPMMENQQHAMMPKQAFRSVNDYFQGMLLGAQKNVSPSMPPLKNTFIGQGIDEGHSIYSLNFSTRTTEPVCFQPSEYQQKTPHQQEHIHHQQQQLQQEQQIHYRQQQQPQQRQIHPTQEQLQQQQQIHPQPHQLQQHQQIHPQQQQLQQEQQIHPQQQQHKLQQQQQIHPQQHQLQQHQQIHPQQQQLQQEQQIHPQQQQQLQLQQQQQIHPQPHQLQQHQPIHPQQQQLQQEQQIHPQQHQLRQPQQINHQQQQRQQKLQQQQQQKIQQQQQQLSQQQLQRQQPVLNELTTMTIHQQQTISAHLPRAYSVIERPPQIENWHDAFLSAPKIHDDLSHIPWGQHELDLGYQVDLRMRPQYPQTRTPLPQNAEAWFFNTQKNLSE